MQFRIQEITTSENPVFIPQYRENEISIWKNFIDPIFRAGYSNFHSLNKAENFIDNFVDNKYKVTEITHEYYRGEQ